MRLTTSEWAPDAVFALGWVLGAIHNGNPGTSLDTGVPGLEPRAP